MIKITSLFFVILLHLITNATAQSLTVGGTAVTGLATTYVGGAANQPVLGFSVTNTTGAAIVLNRIQFTHNSTNLNENFLAGSYRLGTSTAAYGTFTLIPSTITIGTPTITCDIGGAGYSIPASTTVFIYFRASVRSAFNASFPTRVIFNIQSSTANFRNTLGVDVTTNAYGNISNVLIPNLARTEGTAYYWHNIPLATPTSNVTRTADTRINDGVTTSNYLTPPDVTVPGNWQAAGVTWPTAKNLLGSVKYYNAGPIANNIYDNLYFEANIQLQYTTDGTTWLPATGWSIFPAYPYSYLAANQTYTFTGPTLSSLRGVRVIGQLRNRDPQYSYALGVFEVEAFPVNVYYFKPTQSVVETLANWGVNTDGTGNAPSSFAESTQYYFTSTETFNTAITSSSATNFIIGNGGPGVTLTMGASASISNATVDIPLASSGSNTLEIAGATAPIIGILSQGALGSTIVYNGGVQTVGNYNYNNLQINNNGIKTLGGNTTVNRDLSINAPGTTPQLAIGANTLTLNGTVSNLNSQRNIIANGSSNLTIGGTGALGTLFFDQTTAGVSSGSGALSIGSTNRLLNFVMNRTSSGTVTLGNELQITRMFTPTAGTLNTGGNLVMLSTDATTSSIGNLTNATINGIVNIQSFFKGGTVAANRGYRMICSPIAEVGAPNNFFKKLQDRFIITGFGGPANGFDFQPVRAPNAPTLVSYFEPGSVGVTSFQYPSSISFLTTPAQGHYFFFRGNRSNLNALTPGKINEPFSVPEDWTATYIGTVNRDNISFPVTRTAVDAFDGINLVGNPYPSVFDFDAFRNDASNVGVIDDFVKIMKRDRTGFVDRVAGVINGLTSSELSAGGAPGSAVFPYIQPGQGFFIRKTNAGLGSVTFKETHKAASIFNDNALRTLDIPYNNKVLVSNSRAETRQTYSNRRQLLRLNVNDGINQDDATLVLEDGNDPNYSGNDAPYLANNTIFCYTLTDDSVATAINFIPDVDSISKVNLFVLSMQSNSNLKLNFPLLLDSTEVEVSLKDNYLNKLTKLTNHKSTYDFGIDKSVVDTYGKKRFVLIFKELLPSVRMENFSAYIKNNGVKLVWNTYKEKNLDRFDIERSTDSLNFKWVARKNAIDHLNKESAYEYLDRDSPNGRVYYRLKISDKAGNVKYSSIQSVIISVEISDDGLSVYPIPVIDDFKVSWITKDKVSVYMYDMIGREVKVFPNISNQMLRIDARDLIAGIYIIKLKSNNSNSFIASKKIVKQ